MGELSLEFGVADGVAWQVGHRQLADLDSAYGLFRVGRMDGALVFDAKPSIPDLVAQFSELIEATARRASAACEVCGGEGELRAIHGLAEVLCPAHQGAAARAESRRRVDRKPMAMVPDQVP